MGSLNVRSLALTGAVLWGAYLSVMALLVGWGVRFMWFSQEAVEMASAFYPGYQAGLTGALAGLFYGLICGAVCGGVTAWVYNRFQSFS